MPKPNRPMVRDGRLQAPKKRTDRSYLRPTPSMADEELPDDAGALSLASDAPDEAPAETMSEAPDMPVAAAVTAEAPARVAPPPATAAPSRQREEAGPSTRSAAPATGKLPTAVRAIQQQGVRKRRDVDLHALAVRDTNYAIHEMRRIAILTVMVIISLTVLTIILR